MAMIYELGLPAEDLRGISACMHPDYTGEDPQLSDMGAKVLDRVREPNRGLWRVIVGRFVEYEHIGQRSYRTPDGEMVTYADSLMDDKGRPSGRWGLVVEDYEAPTDAFEIGTPL